MMHTLIELVAISLWSSVLGLAFDDYFSTPIQCTAWSPDQRFTTTLGDATLNEQEKERLCDLQGALVGLIFVSLILYCCVLVVSLFRIMSRMSKNT
jgi:hypothetical protein